MPEQLWMEVHNIVQEAIIKTIPKKKKHKKNRMIVWGGLTNSWEKKRSKRQKERYIHLNSQFQRIARRNRKAFLSDQCKEIEGSNRMGKTRDLFKKIRDTKGTFKDGHNKGQKWHGSNRSRTILRRGGKNTQKNYTNKKKNTKLHDPDNLEGVITHVEPDILECKVKWTLGSITMKS